jgi:hypothetical protein
MWFFLLLILVGAETSGVRSGGWPCELIGYNLSGEFCWQGGVAECRVGILAGRGFTWCSGLRCFQGRCVSKCDSLGNNLTGEFCWDSKVLVCSYSIEINVTDCPLGCREGRCNQPIPQPPFLSTPTGIVLICGIILFACAAFGVVFFLAYIQRRKDQMKDYIRVQPSIQESDDF